MPSEKGYRSAAARRMYDSSSDEEMEIPEQEADPSEGTLEGAQEERRRMRIEMTPNDMKGIQGWAAILGGK